MILDLLLDLEKNPSAVPYGTESYNLDRFRAWLESLGTPQAGQVFLHIAGTKGKGSTAALSEALLGGAGIATCMYSSPHLEHFGERFRVDGVPWDFEEFKDRLQAFYSSLGPEQRHGLDTPHRFRTVFETLTALALVEFRAIAARRRASGDQRPAVVVWETGLGGRLDCTNVVDPAVTTITAIGMDHMKILGETIEEIAREKAGIIKPGVPVVISRQAPEHEARVLPVLLARAQEVGAPVVRAWDHNPVLHSTPTDEGQRLRIRFPDGSQHDAALPLRGQFQRANVEAAIASAWYAAQAAGIRPSAETMAAGLARANWPGRLEIHRDAAGRMLVLDGAHCPLSAAALGTELRGLFPARRGGQFVLLFAMQRDKQHREFLVSLLSRVPPETIAGIIAYPVAGPRGAEPADLARVAQQAGFPAASAASPEDALRDARATGCHIVAAGTLYTIGALRRQWQAGT